jgi:hypothetical protein
MNFVIDSGCELPRTGPNPVHRLLTVRWVLVAVCAVIFASIPVNAQSQNTTPSPPGGALRMDKADDPTPINQPPDAIAQMQMQDQKGKQQNFAQANTERKKQIADDSAKLLKLATDLKTEVDKTTKDTLSLSVIRKADEIERLAHSVKEKMKLTAGAN